MQLTIDEYSRRFKMSKEMVHAKLRAGRLPHTVVDGTTLIEVEQMSSGHATPKPQAPRPTTAGAVIMMYQKENAQLKEKILQLEEKIDRLIYDKEQMLREERDRIELIYASRDEQLKAFLELVNTKLVQENQKLSSASAHAKDPVPPAEIHPPAQSAATGPSELFSYLDTHHYTGTEKKIVKKRFAQAYGSDIRVMQKNGQFILDFSRYDYTDLLAR